MAQDLSNNPAFSHVTGGVSETAQQSSLMDMFKEELDKLKDEKGDLYEKSMDSLRSPR